MNSVGIFHIIRTRGAALLARHQCSLSTPAPSRHNTFMTFGSVMNHRM